MVPAQTGHVSGPSRLLRGPAAVAFKNLPFGGWIGPASRSAAAGALANKGCEASTVNHMPLLLSVLQASWARPPLVKTGYY